MSTPREANGRSIDDQLLMDVQSFLSAGRARLRFADLRSGFSTVDPIRLLDAIVELEKRSVVDVSIAHRASEHTPDRTTQRLTPLA